MHATCMQMHTGHVPAAHAHAMGHSWIIRALWGRHRRRAVYIRLQGLRAVRSIVRCAAPMRARDDILVSTVYSFTPTLRTVLGQWSLRVPFGRNLDSAL